MAYYVYVLISREGYHYTGQTSDIERRLEEHNSGMNHGTKHGLEWKVVHCEEYQTRGEALRRERWLKSGHGRSWIAKNVAGCPPKAEPRRRSP